jgi:SAM-dependent methyltransferase
MLKRTPVEKTTLQPLNHLKMQARIQEITGQLPAREALTAYLTRLLTRLGMEPPRATDLADEILNRLRGPGELAAIESEIFALLSGIQVKEGETLVSLTQAWSKAWMRRAQRLFDGISPIIGSSPGKLLDYGCGNGAVAQLAQDRLGLSVAGADIRNYLNRGTTIRFLGLNNGGLEVASRAFSSGLLNNVLHHEPDYEKILSELTRVVSSQVVVVEAAPVGQTAEERLRDADRLFFIDYLHNRIFVSANVPVPGAFEPPEIWIERFQTHGWKCDKTLDLVLEDDFIEVAHYILVFNR